MNRNTTLASSLLAATAMTFFTGLASADSGGTQDLKRVEVTGNKAFEMARTDVLSVCPAAAVELQEALSTAWSRVEQEGTVRVQFRLKGGSVGRVDTSAGPRGYHHALKRAVRAIDCNNDNASEQLFAFVVHFSDPDSPTGNGAVALLSK